MPSLVQAVLQVFALLASFGSLEDAVVGAVRVAFAFGVYYLDVDYAVRPCLPKAADADVASVAVR